MTPQLMSNLLSYSAMENLKRPYCLKIQTTLIEKIAPSEEQLDIYDQSSRHCYEQTDSDGKITQLSNSAQTLPRSATEGRNLPMAQKFHISSNSEHFGALVLFDFLPFVNAKSEGPVFSCADRDQLCQRLRATYDIYFEIFQFCVAPKGPMNQH